MVTKRMSYNEIIAKINQLKEDSKLAATREEINYFEIEIMMLEDYIASKMD